MVSSADDESQPLMSDIERNIAATHPDAPIAGTDRLEVEESSSGTSTPRFLQDEGPWKNMKMVPYWMRRRWKQLKKWAKGPPDARDYRISPFFPRVQEFPLLLLDRYVPKRKHRIGLYTFVCALWLMIFVLVKRRELQVTELEGWGSPQNIGCGAAYWGSGNTCGLGGDNCRPFNGSGFAFRCPAHCISYQVLNPRAVGDQEIVYRPIVIGGPSDDSGTDATYRGDSYICGSAIHAGFISDQAGGCGVVNLVGRRDNYVSSRRNGIDSIAFDSHFPLSFSFERVDCDATDLRWHLLSISVVFSVILSLFISEPSVFFFTMFIGLFWHIGLSSDQPKHFSIPDLVSNLLGKFLPAMFCAWVMFDRMGVRRTLGGLKAQVEKTVLWLGGCWVGALDNYTFSFIPIQRLSKHDLDQQPGAKAALTIIVMSLAAVVGTQVFFFRQEGRLIKYLKLYTLFITSILLSLALPGLNLRIHHYIIGLLFLPGTSIQIRPSLLYQGILVGLFLNGIARWGFDPILQTSIALQGDAQRGSLLPTVTAPNITLGEETASISFQWAKPPGKNFDGISILVNDVERFRSYFDDDDRDRKDEFVWTRPANASYREYFRFGFVEGSRNLDYTKAGTWTASGEWIEMLEGPSLTGLGGEEE